MSEEKYATKKFLQKNSEIIEDLEEEKDEDVGLDLETGENLDLKPSEEDLDIDTPEEEIKDKETKEKDEEEEIKNEEEGKVEITLNITDEELEGKDNLTQDMIEKIKEEVIEDEKQIEVVTKPKKASNKAILKPKTNK